MFCFWAYFCTRAFIVLFLGILLYQSIFFLCTLLYQSLNFWQTNALYAKALSSTSQDLTKVSQISQLGKVTLCSLSPSWQFGVTVTSPFVMSVCVQTNTLYAKALSSTCQDLTKVSQISQFRKVTLCFCTSIYYWQESICHDHVTLSTVSSGLDQG